MQSILGFMLFSKSRKSPVKPQGKMRSLNENVLCCFKASALSHSDN